MAEIIVGLQLLGEIPDASGKSAELIRFAKVIEQAFNFKFGDIYELKNEIFRRKPYNRTKALDMLRNAILREERKRNNMFALVIGSTQGFNNCLFQRFIYYNILSQPS